MVAFEQLKTEQQTTFLSEIAQLKGQIGELQHALEQEKEGKTGLEKNYKKLVEDIQEQWEIKNTILEVTEILRVNQEKLQFKKNQLAREEFNESKRKRKAEDEIKVLEEMKQENENVKIELERRLGELEDKRMKALGLNKNRSVSPLLKNRKLQKQAEMEQLEREKENKPPGAQTERTTEKKTTGRKPKPGASMESLGNLHLCPETSESICLDLGAGPVFKKKGLQNLKGIFKDFNKEPINISTNFNDESKFELLMSENDFGDIPVNVSQKSRDINKIINFDDADLLRDSVASSGEHPVENYGLSRSMIKKGLDDTASVKESDFDNMKQELQFGTNRETSREQRIQQKLQVARERMREFKKKLGLMKIFLNKYGTRSVQRGSTDIFKAVSTMIKEQQKQNYVLSEDETEILESMKEFISKFKLHNLRDNLMDCQSVKENSKLIANNGYKTSQTPTPIRNNPSIAEDKPLRTRAEEDQNHQYSTVSRKVTAIQHLQANHSQHLDSKLKTEMMISKINKLLN